MHNSHKAQVNRGELYREKKEKEENKLICMVQITDYEQLTGINYK